VIVNSDGLSLRWEDDSKTLQSSIYLRSEVSFGVGVEWLAWVGGLGGDQSAAGECRRGAQ